MARRAPSPPPRPRLVQAVAGSLLANPTSTAGGLVMTAMAVAIMTNALALQSGKHPHPLFNGTRPLSTDAAAPPAAAPREALNLRDRAMVAEIQLALKTRGYYTGDVDGLPGPMTTGAITAFEKATGLAPTGVPSERLLDRLKAGTAPRSEAEPAPLPRAAADLTDLIDAASIPVPVPSPRRQTTAAVEAPVEPETTAALPGRPRPRRPLIRCPPRPFGRRRRRSPFRRRRSTGRQNRNRARTRPRSLRQPPRVRIPASPAYRSRSTASATVR